MRVLVTGGAGFVGSHVVDRLCEDGHEVVVLDSLAAHGGEPPSWWRTDVEAHVADVRDPDAWLRAARGADAVCHQAARVGLGLDPSDIRAYVADNDEGTAAGLWALHRLGFAGRLVLASSMVVYGEGLYRCPAHGDVRPGPRRAADLDAGRFDPPCPACGQPLAWAPVDESAALDPRSVYAATKLHQEHLCAVWGRETGVPVTALRYHNIVGPRCPRDTPYAGVASIFASAVARGERPRVYEDGAQVRDFVHVADVARANVLALTAERPVDGPLNVASGRPRTVLDLAEAACAGTGLTPDIVGGGRLGDVRHIVASPARARAVLGFQSEHTDPALALARPPL
ncbi:MAG TPA: NAD-dependent epimerase/dehydratase family protein [Acidimicrobiales bacterium]|jgi:dTDP-L-rhamnose 4-epimerase